jgi:hypothetical protein
MDRGDTTAYQDSARSMVLFSNWRIAQTIDLPKNRQSIVIVSRISLLALGILTGIALGCDKTHATSVCGKEACQASCNDIPKGNCDIRKGSCQKKIFRAVQCVRGVSGNIPEIETISVDEYQKRLETEYGDLEMDDAGIDDSDESTVDAMVPDTGDSDGGGLRADESEEVDHFSVALSLFGLLPSSTDTEEASIRQQLENTLGFYSSEDKKVTIIDRGLPVDDDYAALLLAHEFVHAIQDQEIGLSDFTERAVTSIDSWIARSCLIEGEANLFEDLAWAFLHDLSVDALYWPENSRWNLKFARRSVLVSDAPYTAAIYSLKYSVGFQYLSELWMDEGSWGVRSMYGAPLLSSVYWMAGYQANRIRTEHWELATQCADAQAPDGFDTVIRQRLGSLVVFAFLGAVSQKDGVFSTETVWEDAKEWRADKFFVFKDVSIGATAVSWRIRFADRKTAERYSQIIDNAENDLTLKPIARDHEIEILASDDLSTLDIWNGTDPNACPVDE